MAVRCSVDYSSHFTHQSPLAPHHIQTMTPVLILQLQSERAKVWKITPNCIIRPVRVREMFHRERERWRRAELNYWTSGIKSFWSLAWEKKSAHLGLFCCNPDLSLSPKIDAYCRILYIMQQSYSEYTKMLHNIHFISGQMKDGAVKKLPLIPQSNLIPH